ncbi:hypothetical protein PHSC3_000331 [Chlamydiales bacterium STE3]|nr:hypothetical protein PHSC3_000331 [Chlamydiales bacterium STE3]
MNEVTKPKKISRNLAFRWGCQQARQEFKNYAESVKLSAAELKKDHSLSSILGNVFDITFKVTVISVRTLLLATAKFIHGLALTIFNPSSVPVKKKDPSNSVSGSDEEQSNKAIQGEENPDASTSSLKVGGSSSQRSDNDDESVSESNEEQSNTLIQDGGKLDVSTGSLEVERSSSQSSDMDDEPISESDEEQSNTATQDEGNPSASTDSLEMKGLSSQRSDSNNESVNEADGENLGASPDSVELECSDFQAYRPGGEFRNLERQEIETSPL